MNHNPNSPTKNFAKIPNILFRTTALSGNAKLLLGYLYTYGKRCYPAYTTIVEHLGLSKPTLSAAVKELERQNVLSYKRGSGRSKKSNEYTIRPVSDWKLDVKRQSRTKRISKTTLLIPSEDKVKPFNCLGKTTLPTPVKPFYSNKTYQKDLLNKMDENSSNLQIKSAIESWHTRGAVPDGFCESVGVSHDELFNAPEGEVERMLGEFFGLNKFN